MRFFRYALVVGGVGVLALGLGFAFQVNVVTRLWPWPDGALSYLFVGSILAAVSAAVIWIGVSGELAALAGGTLNVFVIAAGTSFYLLLLGVDQARHELIPYGLAGGLMAIISIVTFLWSRRLPSKPSTPTPGLVRFSFGGFLAALLLASAGLLLRLPVFPWALNPDSSILFGCFFLGNACYFLYGLLQPLWRKARGQLLSFLAYDLVLIGPFVLLFRTIKPQFALSLVVYVLVLLVSGAIAIYFLFLHNQTRFGAP